MSKRIAVFSFVAAALAIATPSWAFQSTKIATMTASVTTGGAKLATFSHSIRSVTNPFGTNATAITWSGVDPLSTQWKIADQLVVINSTVTDANGGVKIYTDNTAADAVPRFVDPTPTNDNDPDSRAAGLLLGSAGTTSAAPLPMAWSIKASTKVVNGANENTGIRPREPNDSVIPDLTGSDNPYQWLYMTDKSNWDGIDNNDDGDFEDADESEPLALDAPYVKMLNHVGIHFTGEDTTFGGHPDGSNAFVYFQANFLGAQVQQAYQTTALRIESFIE